jgi:hypothetical protein
LILSIKVIPDASGSSPTARPCAAAALLCRPYIATTATTPIMGVEPTGWARPSSGMVEQTAFQYKAPLCATPISVANQQISAANRVDDAQLVTSMANRSSKAGARHARILLRNGDLLNAT